MKTCANFFAIPLPCNDCGTSVGINELMIKFSKLVKNL